jgi:hypothetical protein
MKLVIHFKQLNILIFLNDGLVSHFLSLFHQNVFDLVSYITIFFFHNQSFKSMNKFLKIHEQVINEVILFLSMHLNFYFKILLLVMDPTT